MLSTVHWEKTSIDFAIIMRSSADGSCCIGYTLSHSLPLTKENVGSWMYSFVYDWFCIQLNES